MSQETGSDRGRRLLLAAVVAAAALLASGRAFGWGFDEHTQLGRKGYREACNQLAQELNIDIRPRPPQVGVADTTADPCLKPKDQAAVRLCLACRTFSDTLYGQSIAIAGDHVGDPEDLMSTRGQVVATSVSRYTFLALVNEQHFHPAAPRNWRKFHDKALELATKDFPDGPIARDFERVFYTSAFADHFLQDSFSSGHADFNRPSSSAVASKEFHDMWNQSGRRVRSATGRCWIQYGDGKLAYATNTARFQIDEAEKASVYDVLKAFVTGKRDADREVRPVYYMPYEISRDPLPGLVWAPRGETPRGQTKKVDPENGATQAEQAAWIGKPVQAKNEAKKEEALVNPKVINDMHQQQLRGLVGESCPGLMSPIDGISNAASIGGGFDIWLMGAGHSGTRYGSIDLVYNLPLFTFMSLPFAWEGGVGGGYLRRDGQSAFAPGATLGLVTPPWYLLHGLWRNEIGVHATGYVAIGGSNDYNGYVAPFLRSSIEAATVIFRLQGGPILDFRTGRIGVVAGFAVQFSGFRFITGGGSLKSF